MRLTELCQRAGCDAVHVADAAVTRVTADSRRVVPGSVFVATVGEHADGHDFAGAAVKAGAVAVMGGRPGLTSFAGAPYLYVAHPRRALGVLAHALVGDPSRSMTVIGVTGTNGKSSSVALAGHILDASGARTAVLGTLGYAIGGSVTPAPLTTPFAEDLAELFRRAREAGYTHAAMEASSHALEQERVAGIDFDVALFTNLSQDHLDYHGDMERYKRAKVLLFERIHGAGRFTVVNADDPAADAFRAASQAPCHTYGHAGECRPREIRIERGRTCFGVVTPWGEADIETRLLGEHNVYNVLGVIAVCAGLGVPLDTIAAALGSFESVPGRFERVDAGQPFEVIVDYAHTEDALQNVLRLARSICEGRIILVFGCGGDRDKTKRPKMGGVAATLADFPIVTSDNPRTEDPERILADIEPGLVERGKVKGRDFESILDRAQAIRRGIEMARPGDLVLIAGKGHEDYQILGTERIHFDDREVAREVLEAT